MKTLLSAFFGILICAGSVSAADPADAPIAISGGYSVIRDTGITGNGWYADVGKSVGSVYPGLSIAGEFFQHFANQTLFVSGTSINADATVFGVDVGPRYFFRMQPQSTVQPFVNLLVGGQHGSGRGSVVVGGTLQTVSVSDNAFFVAVGGGFDFIVNKTVSLRIRPELAHSDGNVFRFSAGFVWRPER